jgi:hypothetical protein
MRLGASSLLAAASRAVDGKRCERSLVASVDCYADIKD